MDEARYLKRKIRSGTLDVHPTEKALVVNYDVEALILGELGDPMLGDRKECQKIIRLKSLNTDTNVALLAKEVIEKCSLIHESKLHEVEQLIYYLQNRRSNNDGYEVNAQPPRPTSTNSMNNENNSSERAVISNIDSYIELLYEEIPDKVKGSSLILQLARIPDNLLELAKNESLLSALARVLREDWRRSIELSTNIIYIFFCFSTYTRFHNIVLEYRIGSLCMDIIDFELQRYDQWRDDMEKHKRHFESNTGLLLFPTNNGSDIGDKKMKFFDDIWNADSPLEFEVNSNSKKFKEVDMSSLKIPECEVKRLKDELEKNRKKFKSLTKKQEQLLRVAFYLLLNIAENTEVERKMRKKNVIGMLIKTLDRFNSDLLILVVTFLKKLAIFRENKDLMAEENVIEKVPKLLQTNNSDLLLCTLKLLFNLSFDTKMRGKMIRVGLLPRLIKFLTNGEIKNKSTILGLLYHASMDDKVKAMFPNTDCVPMLTDMLLTDSGDERHKPELLALCINLALNNKNAQLMVENNRLQKLIKKAFRNQDALIMKMIRNISQHDSTKENFVDFVGDFAMAVNQSDSQDFVLEIVGIMGNLTLDLAYSQILQTCKLVPWIRNNLVPGKAKDDLVLEIVIFLGTSATDEDCAQLMCKADILLSLIELLKAKQEDDEIVLQIIYVFYQISKHDLTRDYLIRETEAPGYLIDLMHDKNSAIRKVCEVCLDLIAMYDKDWASRIKVEKFRSHNQQWIEMVESIVIDPANHILSGDDEDDNLPPFLSGDLLKHTMLFPSGISASFNITDDGESVTKASSESSENPSRPISRYSRDIDDLNELMARSKSRISLGSVSIDDFYPQQNSKSKFTESESTHVLI
ncbi:kinesin-associated protein 3 [Leptopilina heterotoma]|uniref:kinesin-associated protein 3 n=1 Tax=Leptopilina heterotoma TaxID=63436 RepID=UPI001CA87D39|nr:kinesin-associated protein 3 [Leptopilina heterotoma]